MPDTSRPVCVLTGDIVKSTSLAPAEFEAVMGALETVAGTVAAWHAAPAAVCYARFRGDGWQLLLAEPQWALRASLFARAAIRRACDDGETRLAAGIGIADRGATLASSTGMAFELAGHGLESLKTHQLWMIDGGFSSAAERSLAQGLFCVCDAFSRDWTARQADIFMRLAAPDAPTMAHVADALSVQPQTVQTHFARAGGHALLDAVDAFERAHASAEQGDVSG